MFYSHGCCVVLFLPHGWRSANLQPAEGEGSWHAKMLGPKASAAAFLHLLALTLTVSKAALIFICPSTCHIQVSFSMKNKNNVWRIETGGNWLQFTHHRSSVGSDKAVFSRGKPDHVTKSQIGETALGVATRMHGQSMEEREYDLPVDVPPLVRHPTPIL